MSQQKIAQAKAKKEYDKYSETMIYEGEKISNIQLLVIYKNGDYDTLDSKFSDEYAGGDSVDESSFKKYANKYDFYTNEEDNVIRITSNEKELLDKIEKDYSDRIAHREYDEYIEVFKNKKDKLKN